MVVTQLLYFTYALIKRYLLVANGDDRRVSPVRVETGISISFLTPPTYSLAGHRERKRGINKRRNLHRIIIDPQYPVWSELNPPE